MGYTCPFCGAASHNPNDEKQRYCGRCHQFEDIQLAALLNAKGPILPTHSCFDDALDYLTMAAKFEPERLETLRLVHAICLAQEGPHKDERFAHAWVEDEGHVWQGGILNGQRVWCGLNRDAFYAEMRVQQSTVYTAQQALIENWKHGTYGPWKPEYKALCGGDRRIYGEL